MAAPIDIPTSPSAEEYSVDTDQGDVFTSDDPISLFGEWFAHAKQFEVNDANAMALATVDQAGMPDVRIVLLKDVTEAGFTFHTNGESAKGLQLLARPVAALCFHWKTIRRQIRIRGMVEVLPDKASDDYFATRARGARIGAWASEQSRVMPSATTLVDRIAEIESQYEGKDVPRPPHWRGYCVIPESIEFWVNRPFRLHDRLLFTRNKDGWAASRLYP